MKTDSLLLTDHYQIMMAYSYWKLGMSEREAVFHLSFRKLPKKSTYMVAAGLEKAIHFLREFTFSQSDLNYLQSLNYKNRPIFPIDFLHYLQKLSFTCDLDAVLEGTLIYAQEPVLRIQGPILQCQILESPLLNFLNFATLIATKASRVYLAAGGDPVIEYGLRRAQGPDGALTASRSAYLGGCSSTSNLLAGKLYGIPTQGTQAHSWIMAFPTEQEAFEKFAHVMKNMTSLLVDTYDTLKGVLHAIEVGQWLRKEGMDLAAIRLDSGNLLELSRKSRQLLDQAGFRSTQIIASGDLDENIIHTLKSNAAPIDAWGVGTRLVTSYDQPTLNTIYKLSALKNTNGQWEYKMKLSNDPHKATLPGILQVSRIYEGKVAKEDIIQDINIPEAINLEKNSTELLKPIFRKGKLVYSLPTLHEIRSQFLQDFRVYREKSPKPYPVSLGPNLQKNIKAIMSKIRANNLT
jgi:nicotinate phosphoribosyltransferase